MKKLLITTMAAASLAFCAKADLTVETFEGKNEGSFFGLLSDDSSKYYIDDGWDTETTIENLFTVTNFANYVGASTYPAKEDRPSKSDSANVLAIDTSAPLLRYADSTEEAQDVSTTPVFFDSLVQFTATDVVANPDTGSVDKLRVWLYTSPDDVSETNPGLFNETTTKKTLVITAGVLETNDGVQSIVKKDYDTGIEIESESWHRLTIKSFLNEDKTKLMFNVWVDGAKDPITAEGVTDFLSLVTPNEDSDNYLQGVAFDGKGAIDDIVFTTENPFAVAPETPKEFFLNLALSADDAAEATLLAVYAGDDEIKAEDDGSYKIKVETENALAWVYCAEGYKVANKGATYDEGGYWIVPINVADATENETVNVTITVEEVGGGSGEEPTTPTVEPGKPVECDSEEDAKKVTITVTDADAAAAGQADVIKAVVKQNGNKWVVTAEIDTEATGYIPADTTLVEVAQKLTEIANATEDQDGNVTVALKDVTPGLYYSVDVSENLAGENQGFAPGTRTLATANGSVTLKVSKPKGNSAFFKVVQHLTKE